MSAIFLNVNHPVRFLRSQIVTEWKRRQYKTIELYVTNPLGRDDYMGRIEMTLQKNGLIYVTYNVDVYFTHRGYVHKFKHSFTEYSENQQIVWDVTGPVFYNQLKAFIEYCRAIYVDCERLEAEIMALEWSYVLQSDSTGRHPESPVDDYQFVHLLR